MTGTNETLGFLGLGNMGGRIASCLVRAGRDVLGYDTRRENIEACGASPASSIADVAAGADIVLLSLPDSRVVEAVTLGDGGLHAHCRPGQIVVDLTTAAPASTVRLHGMFGEKGCRYFDAGVSGGAAAADKGELTLMVGSEPADLDRVRPTLEVFAKDIFLCGGVGAGHTAKLLNNFLNAVALSATSEVMVAARKAGLDLAVMLDVLNNSSGVNFATLNRFPRIIQGDYLEGGLTNSLMVKDVAAYVDLIAGLGVAGLNVSGPLASFGLALQLGYADRISNTVVDAIGDVSGGVRLHDKEWT